MVEEKYVEVDGQKFVDDGTGSPKLDESGQSIPFVEEQTVPIGRFNEVYKKTKELEEEIGTLKTKPGEQLTPEQQKEQQAKSYLKNLVKEEREEAEKAIKETEAKEQKDFESEVDDILAIHTDVSKDEFLKFVEEKGDEYGVKSVKGAMKLFKDLGKLKTDTEEETKENINKKPDLPKSEGTSPSKTPPDDSEKTYQQVVDEELRATEKGQK